LWDVANFQRKIFLKNLKSLIPIFGLFVFVGDFWIDGFLANIFWYLHIKKLNSFLELKIYYM
jgi:hypothetical protein